MESLDLKPIDGNYDFCNKNNNGTSDLNRNETHLLHIRNIVSCYALKGHFTVSPKT